VKSEFFLKTLGRGRIGGGNPEQLSEFEIPFSYVFLFLLPEFFAHKKNQIEIAGPDACIRSSSTEARQIQGKETL